MLKTKRTLLVSSLAIAAVLFGAIHLKTVDRDPSLRTGIVAARPAEDASISQAESTGNGITDSAPVEEPQSVAHGVTPGAGKHAPEPAPVAGDTAPDAYDMQISRFVRSFQTEAPDILGWDAYLGQLAMIAKVDPASFGTNSEGATTGRFTLPESDKTIQFEIAADGYRITLDGELPSGEGRAGYSSNLAWKAERRNIESAHGVLHMRPHDPHEVKAGEVVGHVYDMKDGEAQHRPLRSARTESGEYGLRNPSNAETVRLEGGDLLPTYNWLLRLQEIDTAEAVRRRTGPVDGK